MFSSTSLVLLFLEPSVICMHTNFMKEDFQSGTQSAKSSCCGLTFKAHYLKYYMSNLVH